MSEKLLGVRTTYIPVTNMEPSSEWYVNRLDEELSYKEGDFQRDNLLTITLGVSLYSFWR